MTLLIESFLDGIEVSVGVMNYQKNIKVFGITELITENDFFDYDAKYNGNSKEVTPANISEKQKQQSLQKIKSQPKPQNGIR